MVQTTIARTPPVLRPSATAEESRPPTAFERESSAGMILMLVFSLVLIAWIFRSM